MGCGLGALARWVLLMAINAGSADESMVAKALDTMAGKGGVYDSDLNELVAFPSISALPEHYQDVMAAAQWLMHRLERAGLENTKVYETEGPHPVVYGDWLKAPGKPTVLIYGHYDVQPVDPLEAWHSDPFNASFRDGYYYGRGAEDDKGGLLMAVQAVEALLEASTALDDSSKGQLPLNVKFLLEGEEEVLSPHLKAFLRDHADLLAADLCLSADGRQVSEHQGGVLLGLRGVLSMQVDVVTAATDMHSGIMGGSVPNPSHVLVDILASLHDPATGRILVDGFYDGVLEMTDEDKHDIEQFGFNETVEQQQLGLQGLYGEAGYNTLQRRWHRPTLEVVGLQGGFTGSGIKTVIPRSAFAKLSCRLVPGQAPDDVLSKVQAHILKVAPSTAITTVTRLGGGSLPWTSPRDTPGNRAAAEVSARVMGVPPLYHRDGATIPALAALQTILGMPTTVFGWTLGDNIHAPNERLKATMYSKGREAWARLLLLLGEDNVANELRQPLLRGSIHNRQSV